MSLGSALRNGNAWSKIEPCKELPACLWFCLLSEFSRSHLPTSGLFPLLCFAKDLVKEANWNFPRLSPAMEFRYMGRGHFICGPIWTFEVAALINRAVCNLSEDADYWLKPMTLTAEFLIFIDFAP